MSLAYVRPVVVSTRNEISNGPSSAPSQSELFSPVSVKPLLAVTADFAEITPATSAYTKHFRWIVRSVAKERIELARLLTPAEHECAENILQLSACATLLYARMFGRQGNLFFASELVGERFCRSLNGMTTDDIYSGMRELAAVKMITFPLDGKPDNEECLHLIDHFSKPLMVALLSRIGGNATSSKTKEDVVQEIRRIATKQRTLFGGQVCLYKHIKHIFKEHSSVFREKKERDTTYDAIVNLAQFPRVLCRRMYSLFYLTSIASGSDDSSYDSYGTRAGADANALDSARVNSALPNDGLMVMFGKRVYENYTPRLTTSVFPSRDAWLAFERAVELARAFSTASTEDESMPCINRNSANPSVWCALDGDVGATLAKSSFDTPELRVPHTWKGWNVTVSHGGTCAGCLLMEASARLTQAPMPAPSTPQFLQRFYEGYVLLSVVWEGVALLEKQKQYGMSLALLFQLLQSQWLSRRRGKWWIRVLVDANHLKWSPGSLLALAKNALIDPHVYEDGGEMFDLRKRCAKLEANVRRLTGIEKGDTVPTISGSNFNFIPADNIWTIVDRPYNNTAGKKSKFVGYNGVIGCSVEELALQYLQKNDGWTGIHCEGGVIHALFGLLMWDVIFDDTVENVFATPFQHVPLDFGYPEFEQARETSIKTRLATLTAASPASLADMVFKSWDLHYGVQSIVQWQRWTAELLGCAAACLGGSALSFIFKRLATNFRHWGGGLPDDMVWRLVGQPWNDWSAESLGGRGREREDDAVEEEFYHAPASPGHTTDEIRKKLYKCIENAPACEAMLVEVKGPRDRLDGRQTAWLRYLIDHGVQAGVCRVQEPKATKQTLSKQNIM